MLFGTNWRNEGISQNNSTSYENNIRGAFQNLKTQQPHQGKNSEWNDFEYQFISKKPFPTFKLPK